MRPAAAALDALLAAPALEGPGADRCACVAAMLLPLAAGAAAESHSPPGVVAGDDAATPEAELMALCDAHVARLLEGGDRSAAAPPPSGSVAGMATAVADAINFDGQPRFNALLAACALSLRAASRAKHAPDATHAPGSGCPSLATSPVERQPLDDAFEAAGHVHELQLARLSVDAALRAAPPPLGSTPPDGVGPQAAFEAAAARVVEAAFGPRIDAAVLALARCDGVRSPRPTGTAPQPEGGRMCQPALAGALALTRVLASEQWCRHCAAQSPCTRPLASGVAACALHSLETCGQPGLALACLHVAEGALAALHARLVAHDASGAEESVALGGAALRLFEQLAAAPCSEGEMHGLLRALAGVDEDGGPTLLGAYPRLAAAVRLPRAAAAVDAALLAQCNTLARPADGPAAAVPDAVSAAAAAAAAAAPLLPLTVLAGPRAVARRLCALALQHAALCHAVVALLRSLRPAWNGADRPLLLDALCAELLAVVRAEPPSGLGAAALALLDALLGRTARGQAASAPLAAARDVVLCVVLPLLSAPALPVAQAGLAVQLFLRVAPDNEDDGMVDKLGASVLVRVALALARALGRRPRCVSAPPRPMRTPPDVAPQPAVWALQGGALHEADALFGALARVARLVAAADPDAVAAALEGEPLAAAPPGHVCPGVLLLASVTAERSPLDRPPPTTRRALRDLSNTAVPLKTPRGWRLAAVLSGVCVRGAPPAVTVHAVIALACCSRAVAAALAAHAAALLGSDALAAVAQSIDDKDDALLAFLQPQLPDVAAALCAASADAPGAAAAALALALPYLTRREADAVAALLPALHAAAAPARALAPHLPTLLPPPAMRRAALCAAAPQLACAAVLALASRRRAATALLGALGAPPRPDAASEMERWLLGGDADAGACVVGHAVVAFCRIARASAALCARVAAPAEPPSAQAARALLAQTLFSLACCVAEALAPGGEERAGPSSGAVPRVAVDTGPLQALMLAAVQDARSVADESAHGGAFAVAAAVAAQMARRAGELSGLLRAVVAPACERLVDDLLD